jgi:nucleoside-diphosphate-sugar epimerase
MTACPVFVTGGSGVVGRHVVAALVRRGTPVRALARSARAAGIVTAAGAEPVPGELGDRDALRRGLTGAAAVIHCAARLEQGGPRAGYLTDNLHRTVEVLESARACGVGRFVHIGAAMCLLGGPPLDGADETWPLREPGYSGYIISKTRADAAVRAANSPGFTTVVVRPGWVWGTVDDPQLRETAQAVRAGKMRLIDHGRHHIVTSHVDNTVEAVVLALRHGRGGSGYYAFDDEPTTGLAVPPRPHARPGSRAARRVPARARRPRSRSHPLSRLEGSSAPWTTTHQPPAGCPEQRAVPGERPTRPSRARLPTGHQPTRRTGPPRPARAAPGPRQMTAPAAELRDGIEAKEVILTQHR